MNTINIAKRLLLIALVFSLECKGTDRSVILGKNHQPKDSAILFVRVNKNVPTDIQFADKFEDTQLLDFGTTDTIKVISHEPIVILNSTSDGLRWFRFFPGETINVYKEKFSSTPVYSTGNASRDKEIAYSAAYSYFPLSKKTILPNNKGPVDSNNLDNYIKANNLSKQFAEEEKANLIYNVSVQNTSSLLLKPKINVVDLEPYIKIINSAQFPYLLSYRVLLFNLVEALKRVYVKDPINGSFKWLADNLTGEARDIALFKLIKNVNDPAFNTDKTAVIIKKYITISSDSGYQAYLSKNNDLAKARFITNNEDLVINDSGKVTDLKSLLLNLKKTVVYVDLWASWCVPCRAEMPFSQKLKNDLTNDKKIKFIYLSFDTNKAAWENAERQLNINDSSSFLMVKNFKSEFSKNIKLKTIPRYLIFNKEGQIAFMDAIRPSDPKLKKILVDLSNQ